MTQRKKKEIELDLNTQLEKQTFALFQIAQGPTAAMRMVWMAPAPSAT